MNTEENNKSTEAKHVLCEVAVVAPKYRDFDYFIKNNRKENEIYTWIYNADRVRGKRFNRIEKLFNYYEIQDINNVMDYLETHTVSNPT